MDRLTSLTAFARVVDTGGFSAAARRLGMSVTMVSNHVQALEERLGARLLNRTTRKVSLTEIGQAYYDRALRILADIDEADRIAGALHATPRGLLRLYAAAAMIRFLTPVIAEFLTTYPAVSVDLSVGERMVDVIEEGYDLVIRPVMPPDSTLVARQLSPWRHVVCCAPSYLAAHPAPAEPDDLVHHNCLRYAQYPYGEDWHFEDAEGRPVSVRVRGNLVTSAPTFAVADDLASGTLLRLLPDHRGVEFTISAIYPHRHHLSTKVRFFIDLLAERFAAHRAWMDLPRRGG
jgi:DNA-binding transcriptional LysR family regulator